MYTFGENCWGNSKQSLVRGPKENLANVGGEEKGYREFSSPRGWTTARK